MAGNSNFDAILSTTLNNYRDQFEDNIFTAQPLTAWLKRKDHVKLISGGAKIVVQLMYGTSSAAGSFAGYDTLTTTAQTGLTAAEFPWGQYYATIAINGLEEAQNQGEAEIIDLLGAKTTQAEMTISENMDLMFLKDGTGNANKDWLGLMALVGDKSDTVKVVGNIDSNSGNDDYWQSYVDRNGGVDKTLSLADMTTAYNTASKGNDHPDLVLSGQTLFEKYESLLQPQLRFSDSKTADGGFQNLLFKGSVYMFDVNIVNATVANHHKRQWFLNSKYLRLFGHRDKWFVNTPFVRPNNQDARYAQILAYGQLTISNRKRQARLDNRIP